MSKPTSALNAIFSEEHGSRKWWLLAILCALLFHGFLGFSAQQVKIAKKTERITIKMAAPPPPPPPPPVEKLPDPPEPPKVKPPPPMEKPPPPPPSNSTPPEPVTDPVPIVTGISANSVVPGSGGPAVRVGNTTMGDPSKEKFVDPNQVKAYSGGSPDGKATQFSPVPLAEIDRQAGIKSKFNGPYPKTLADQGIAGDVVLSVDIGRDGKTKGTRLIKSSGHTVLDKLAAEYLKRFVWTPAFKKGEAVDSTIRYTYRFEITE